MNEMRILIVGSIYLYFKMLELLIILRHNIIRIISKDKNKFNLDFYNSLPFNKTYEVPNFITNDKKTINRINFRFTCSRGFRILKNN